MSIAAIIEKVQVFAPPLVLVTGGEPLAQKNCIPLLAALLDSGLSVQLETAGAHDISHVPEAVSIIMDIKTPGSGESARNRWQNITHLKANDEVKVVINSRDDYAWAKQMLTEKGVTDLPVPILFSPAWGRLDPAQLVAWILTDRLPVRLQLQQHKYIWGADIRGV